MSAEPGPQDGSSDEQFLAALPIRARLAKHRNEAVFVEQALLYKHLRPAIAALQQQHRPAPQDVLLAPVQVGTARLYSARIAAALATAPPERWTICALCDGRGRNRHDEAVCSDCGGQGFEIGFLDADEMADGVQGIGVDPFDD